MRKVKNLPYLCIAAIALIFAIIFSAVFLSGGNLYADAAYNYEYSRYIAGYNAVYDIRADRTITVTEDLTFHFYNNSGFVRDIPVNAGEKIKNIEVCEITDGVEKDVYYDVYHEQDEDGNDFLCVDMGSAERKTGFYTFRLTYDYIVPATKQEGDKFIALTSVGGGYEFEVENIDIKLILPQGFTVGEETKCFPQGTKYELEIIQGNENGRITLSAHCDGLPAKSGLRFDVQFDEGVLTAQFDFAPVWAIIAGVVLLLLLLIIRLACFGKRSLTPIVNFEAPKKMDPLAMGKLIDTKVNQEDITSMIFYFADKGYLKINLENEKDPTLIRILQSLPEGCADYERLMFEKLFASGEVVKTSSLANSFYTTVEKVTAKVNAKYKGFYTGSSMACALIFAVLGGLFMGLVPFVIGLLNVSTKYHVLAPFISIVPALVIFALSQTVKWYELKFDKKKKLLFSLGIALLCVVFCLIYALLVPKWLMGFWQKFAIAAVSCLIITLSVTLVSRSKEYDEQLNEIVGFKNFITLAEKDRLEAMLADDPQFYYHVLPYAQVLGVSDIWTDKFKDITIEPPRWATSSVLDTAFRLHVFNSLMRNMTSGISRNLNSRPSSNGASGGGSGHFGGFSGGGHGGGGGHFR